MNACHLSRLPGVAAAMAALVANQTLFAGVRAMMGA